MKQLFHMFTLHLAEAVRLSASASKAHQHDYEELIVAVKGSLEHFIDYKTTRADAPFLSFITKGKVHMVTPIVENDDYKMWVIRFKSEFIPETTFQLYSCFHDNANIILQEDLCFNRFNTLCELMNEEYQQPTPDYAVLKHLLSALFTMLNVEMKKVSHRESVVQNNQSETFKNFLNILEDNFMRPLGVEFYAEKLFMSSRNLNIICQNIMQQSVSEIIETRKLTEAKNLLTTTNKSIAEIGFELGYNEKAYFSNVFKKKSGQTPSAFRQEMKELIS